MVILLAMPATREWLKPRVCPPHVAWGSGLEAALALLLLVGLQLAACNSTDHQEVAQLAYSAFAHEILLAWKTFCCIWHLACLLCQAPWRP